MNETKLTPAQKRAIREARKNGGVIIPEIGVRDELIAMRLGQRYYVTGYPDWDTAIRLTEKGWAVEVGNEDR